MSVTTIYHNGTQDFQGNELHNWKTHFYATLAQMNGDLSVSVGRIVYVVEDNRFYFGKSGSWQGLGAASSFETAVDTPGDLPMSPLPPVGQVRVVLADPDNGNLPALWIFDGTAWQALADEDERIIIASGLHAFTGIPQVTDPDTVVPTADEHLTTKKYADDAIATAVALAIAAHLADSDPHPQYTTDAEASAIADTQAAAAVATHEAAIDPHPQYTTDAEATAIADTEADAKVAAHDADPNPHAAADFQTSAQVAATVAAHDTDPAAHDNVIQQLKDILEGADEEAGQLIDEFCFVEPGLVYGTPVTRNGVSGNYELAVNPEDTVGLALKASTEDVIDSAITLIIDNATSSVELPGGYDMTKFLVGQVYNFPDTALNSTTRFVIRQIVGLILTVDPAPQTETIGSDIVLGNRNGTVVFGGRISIPEQKLTLPASNIVDITVNAGGGTATIEIDPATVNISGVMPGDLVTLSGTSDNDGSGYVIDRIESPLILLAPLETTYNIDLPIINAAALTKTFEFGGGPDLSAVVTALGADEVVKLRVANSTSGSNDKIFTVVDADDSLKTVTVTEIVVDDVTGAGTLFNDEATQLPGTDETGAGTITIYSPSESHDFLPAPAYDGASTATPVPFYFDLTAPDNYGVTPSAVLLGHQIDRYTFIVNIQQVSSIVRSYTDADNGDVIPQFNNTIVYYDDTGGAVALLMPAGRDGDEITVKSIVSATNGITLTRDGADVFEGGTTDTLNTAFACRKYKFFSGTWLVLFG